MRLTREPGTGGEGLAMLLNPAYSSIDTAPHMTKRMKRILEDY